jgi:uncharacterized membrane protein YozB (DUF420 family)
MSEWDFPAMNAGLNAASTVLILAGRVCIARRWVRAHRNAMLGAVAASTLFLISYLYYHFAVRGGQPTRFQGEGAVRWLYFALLGTHTLLAATVVPLVITAVRRGLRDDRSGHRRIVAWTYPIWLYVSATGVVIYLMLYRWYAA